MARAGAANPDHPSPVRVRTGTGQGKVSAWLAKKGPAFRPSLKTHARSYPAEGVGCKPLTLAFYMDPHQQSQVKAPEFAPVFLPSLVIGNFDPREVAIILALQGYGASSNRVQITYENLSAATKITKGALPLLISKLESIGIVKRERTYDKQTGKVVYYFSLYIWKWAENTSR